MADASASSPRYLVRSTAVRDGLVRRVPSAEHNDVFVVDQRGPIGAYPCLAARLTVWRSADVNEPVSRTSPDAPTSTGSRSGDDEVRAARAQCGATRQLVRLDAAELVGAIDDAFDDTGDDESPALAFADAVGVEDRVGNGGPVRAHPLG